MQASEKTWGAVAHALKSVAKERGWTNFNHAHVVAVGTHLSQEFQRPTIIEGAFHGNTLHLNFYENRLRGDEILFLIDRIEGFLADIVDVRARGPQEFTIENSDQRARLRTLTGNRGLQIGDSSPVGFSNNHQTGP